MPDLRFPFLSATIACKYMLALPKFDMCVLKKNHSAAVLITIYRQVLQSLKNDGDKVVCIPRDAMAAKVKWHCETMTNLLLTCSLVQPSFGGVPVCHE